MSENKIFTDKRVAELLEENRLLKELHGRSTEPEILVYVSKYAPSTVIAISKDKSIVLEPNSRNASALIPYDVYLKLKRETEWFDKGHLYSDKEEDLENPNLILDIKEWMRARPEAQIRKDIKEITSEGTLNSLYEFTEEILYRQDDERRKTGKVRVVRQEAMKRLSELSGYSLVEDSPE
jgi:hypothetical protein